MHVILWEKAQRNLYLRKWLDWQKVKGDFRERTFFNLSHPYLGLLYFIAQYQFSALLWWVSHTPLFLLSHASLVIAPLTSCVMLVHMYDQVLFWCGPVLILPHGKRGICKSLSYTEHSFQWGKYAFLCVSDILTKTAFPLPNLTLRQPSASHPPLFPTLSLRWIFISLSQCRLWTQNNTFINT